MDMQRFLIWLGLVIFVTGVMWPILYRIGLGRLPGDFMFQRDGTTFYFPVVTCVIISIVLMRAVLAVQSITNIAPGRWPYRCKRSILRRLRDWPLSG